jgi:hypothetical protein
VLYNGTQGNLSTAYEPYTALRRATSVRPVSNCCVQNPIIYVFVFQRFVCFWRDSPPVGHGLLIHEVSRSHSTTHHSRQDSPGRVISSSQGPLPDKHTTLTRDRHACPRWDSNPNLRRRVAVHLHRRPRVYQDRPLFTLKPLTFKNRASYI